MISPEPSQSMARVVTSRFPDRLRLVCLPQRFSVAAVTSREPISISKAFSERLHANKHSGTSQAAIALVGGIQ